MAINLGSGAISKLYLGTTEIQKAYLGSSLVYDAAPAAGLLLDDYPNAEAAYSLRQLKTGITNVVRVRRSSDNAESDFTATQVTDGTLTTWTGANDGFVVTWYDQSGNAVNLTQSTTTAQRQIVSSGSLILENGKPCLSGSASTFLTGFDPAITDVYSSFFVFKTPNITAAWSLIYKDGNNRFLAGDQFGTLRGLFRAGSTYNPVHNTLYTNDAQQLITHIRPTSTTSDAYKNGSANASNTVTTGSGAFQSGHSVGLEAPTMQEIIVWGTDQSANRAAIESEINTHYGIYQGNPVSGLLFDYPNAAAAYSLRQLTVYDNNYKYPLVRVRRSLDNAESDFNETEITDGTLTTFTGSGDGFVTIWYDQSGNARNATQATAANQPQIVSGGSVLMQGSKPIMHYLSSDFLRTSAFSIGVNRTYMMTLFSQTNTNTGFKGYLAFNNNGSYVNDFVNGILGINNASNVPKSYVGSGNANTNIGTGALTNGDYYLLGALVEGSVQHQHYRNGVLNAEDTSLSISPETTARTLDILFTSATGNDLRTNEAVIWDSYQSANRTGIENNINTHYGIY